VEHHAERPSTFADRLTGPPASPAS
jgi:hypothetical protein